MGPALSSALLSRKISRVKLLCEFELGFGVNRDRPDEPEQLAAQRRHDLVFILAADGERLVAFVKAILRFPGYLFDLIAEG